MPTIVNLTPFPIAVWAWGGLRTIESTGIARAVEIVEPAESIGCIPTSIVRYSGTEGLPDPVEGTYYLVSTITAQAASAGGRTVDDLLVPGTPMRDQSGRVIGCASLARVSVEPQTGWVERAVERWIARRSAVAVRETAELDDTSASEMIDIMLHDRGDGMSAGQLRVFARWAIRKWHHGIKLERSIAIAMSGAL